MQGGHLLCNHPRALILHLKFFLEHQQEPLPKKYGLEKRLTQDEEAELTDTYKT